MKAFSPTGHQIIGTLDVVTCRAEIVADSFHKDDAGNIDFEWEGETTVFWDDQKTVQRNGDPVYLDEEGGEWVEDQLVLRDDEDDEDAA
jgi:hypothetical protein